MKKKLITSLLSVLIICGTISFSAFATMPNGTVVIGNKSFDLAYANDTMNLTEVSNEIIKGGAIYVKDFSGNWIDNITGLTVNSSVVPGEEEAVVIATVKPAIFGAKVNATSTKEGATKYQVFDGIKALSAIANLGADTTIFLAKVIGDTVTIKLLNASGALVATTDVTLVATGSNPTIPVTEPIAPVTKPITSINTVNSRQNPANLGELINITIPFLDKGVSKSEVTQVIVKDIIRGDEALILIENANRFNSVPKDGYEYILAKISFNFVKGLDVNSLLSISKYDFKMVSSTGKSYAIVNEVTPEPSLNAYLHEGSSNEGYVVFMVEKTDINPLIVYTTEGGSNIFDTTSVWFKGYKDSAQLDLEAQENNNTNITISNKQELQSYLTKKFSRLQTSIGTAKFTFDIIENASSYNAYDYWIMVKYDFEFFEGINSIKYTSEQKDAFRSELKNFQEKIGTTIVSSMPNKKVCGGYYYSWYRYPTLKIDLIARRYYSWRNYDESFTSDIKKIYENTKPSTFRWYSLIDDNL